MSEQQQTETVERPTSTGGSFYHAFCSGCNGGVTGSAAAGRELLSLCGIRARARGVTNPPLSECCAVCRDLFVQDVCARCGGEFL